MENRNDDSAIAKCVLFAIVIYGIIQLVDAVIAAIYSLLMGLVYVAVGAAAILALYSVYRYITDKQYGETKKMQQATKLEQQRRRHVPTLPKHLREHANEYWLDKQRAIFEPPSHSRLDAMLDKVKQVFSTFR